MTDNHPANMGPQKVDERRMWVRLPVRMLMMQPVYGDPAGWRVLQAADSEQSKEMLEPLGNGQPLVGENPVVTECDAQQPVDRQSRDCQADARPTEVPRHENEQAE